MVYTFSSVFHNINNYCQVRISIVSVTLLMLQEKGSKWKLNLTNSSASFHLPHDISRFLGSPTVTNTSNSVGSEENISSPSNSSVVTAPVHASSIISVQGVPDISRPMQQYGEIYGGSSSPQLVYPCIVLW